MDKERIERAATNVCQKLFVWLVSKGILPTPVEMDMAVQRIIDAQPPAGVVFTQEKFNHLMRGILAQIEAGRANNQN